MLPLQSVRVLDFTTLLPGPLATLMLAEAGAEVVKVERPQGDDMRHYRPAWDKAGGAAFALLNAGKKSITADLNDGSIRETVFQLAASFDVVIEQFRPGVMAKFGLDYESIRRANPRTIYCSITGYGQVGPLKHKAGHDINYLADTGLLALASGSPGSRSLPQVPLGDIAGGAYPAVVNILMALRRRDQIGEGCYLDISMTDNLFSLMYLPWAQGHASGRWPANGAGPMTGGSPRYNLYDTKDGGIVAVGALEEKFWRSFVVAIGLEEDLTDETVTPALAIRRISEIIAGRDAAHWSSVFARVDCCCSVVRDLQDAITDPHFQSRLHLHRAFRNDAGGSLPQLPLPLASQFLGDRESASPPPVLGSSNQDFGLEQK